MPDQTYEVVMHDGRKFRVVADHAPTEEEILAQLPKPEAAPAKLMASHDQGQTPDPSAATREQVLSTIGRYGAIPNVPAGAPGEAMGRALSHPEQWPTLAAGVAAGVAAPFTGGTSLLVPAAAAAGGGGVGSIAKNAAEYFLGSKRNTSAADVAKDVAKDAAIQGGLQLAGGALAKGSGALGSALYRRALGPSKPLITEFPDVVETGIEQGTNVTKAGLAKATEARAASAAAADNIVAQSPAAQAGVKIPTSTLTRGLDPLRAEVAARPQSNLAQQAIDDFEINTVASHPQGFSLQDLVKTKSAAQHAAKSAYKAAETAGTSGMEAEANEAIAKRARGIVEHFAPDVAPQNAETQRLIGLTRALKDANTRNYINRAILGGTAGAIEGVRSRDPVKAAEMAGAGFLATDPRVMGAAGLALARSAPAAQTVTPQAIRAALLAMMGNETESGVSPP